MHIRGDHAELVVGGRLDVRSAADARTVLHSAVDDGAGDLVLDLTDLDSWDATGLGVIMGAHRRAGRCGRRLVLRGVPATDAASAGGHPAAPHSRHRGRHRRGDPLRRAVVSAPLTSDCAIPHETVTSRTGWHPGLFVDTVRAFRVRRLPIDRPMEQAPDQKRQMGVEAGGTHATIWGLYDGPDETGNGRIRTTTPREARGRRAPAARRRPLPTSCHTQRRRRHSPVPSGWSPATSCSRSTRSTAARSSPARPVGRPPKAWESGPPVRSGTAPRSAPTGSARPAARAAGPARPAAPAAGARRGARAAGTAAGPRPLRAADRARGLRAHRPARQPSPPTARTSRPTESYGSPATTAPPPSCSTSSSRSSTTRRSSRPDRAGLLERIRDIGAIVVLDDLEFGGAALDELLDADPRMRLSCSPRHPTSTAPAADSHLEEVFLARPRPQQPRWSCWSAPSSGRSPTTRRTGRATSGSSPRACRCASSRRARCCGSATACARPGGTPTSSSPSRASESRSTRQPDGVRHPAADARRGGRARGAARLPAERVRPRDPALRRRARRRGPAPGASAGARRRHPRGRRARRADELRAALPGRHPLPAGGRRDRAAGGEGLRRRRGGPRRTPSPSTTPGGPDTPPSPPSERWPRRTPSSPRWPRWSRGRSRDTPVLPYCWPAAPRPPSRRGCTGAPGSGPCGSAPRRLG